MKKVMKYLLICFFSFVVVATTWTWSKARTNTWLKYVAEESEATDTGAEAMEPEEEKNDSNTGSDSWQYEESDQGDAEEAGSEDTESYKLDY